MLRPKPGCRRRGAAAVEFAFVMNFVMVPLMIGVWEMGRVVQVQQIVSNAAREGARLAAQGRTMTLAGKINEVKAEVLPANNGGGGNYQPNVKAAVFQSLRGAGLSNLTWDDVTCTFAFTSGSGTEPVAGVKNQSFTVDVSIPYAKVRWVNLGLVNPTVIKAKVQWQMLVDDPFTVNVDVPSW
jgi:Flp pilus assembly protein TadG